MTIVNMKTMMENVNNYGVGAFNIVDFSSMRAVIDAAEEARSPVIIQTSPKTVKFWGADDVYSWFKTCADRVAVPVVLHLDHCQDIDFIQLCIQTGWTSVMYDGSTLPFEDNLANTKKVSKLAHASNVSVEGEIGAIVGVEDDKFVSEDEACLADPELAIRLAVEAELDIIAPACGTAHGVYKKEPHVDFSILEKVWIGSKVPNALHGGTGLPDEVFKKAITLGCKKINVSTQLKITGIDADYDYITKHRDEYNPLTVMGHRLEAYKEMVTQFIFLFESNAKI
jgi:tagatose 1,6-diphosphate aldolase GatY/KbaY